MAIEVNELVTKIRADASGYVGQIKAAIGGTEKLDKSVQVLHHRLKQISMITGIAGAAMAGLLGMAVKSFAEFEKKMANAASMWGVGLDQLTVMTNKAYELGTSTVFSATQVADSYYWMASAGWTAKQSLEAVNGTLTLAAATQSDLSMTTEMVIENIYAFGLAASDTDRVVNVFAETIRSSQATMGKMQESMRYIGPIASQYGMSIEQTSALLGTLYNRGIDASMAGTQLRFSLYHLSNPTKEASKAIARLGLNFSDVNPVTNDFIDIVEKLSKAQVSATTRAQAYADIFGVRAQTAMTIFSQVGADALRQYQAQVTGTDTANKLLEIQMNTLAGQFTIAKNALQTFMEQMGGAAAGMTRKFAETIKNIVQWFVALPEPTKKAAAQIVAITGVALMLTSAIAGLGLVISILIAKLTFLNVMLAGLPIIIGLIVTGMVLLNAATKENTNLLVDNIAKQKESNEHIETLISKYDELSNKEDLNVQEKEKLKKIIEEINKLMPGSIGYFKDENGIIIDDTNSISENYKKRLQLANLSREQFSADMNRREIEMKSGLKYENYLVALRWREQAIAKGITEDPNNAKVIKRYEDERKELDALYKAYNNLFKLVDKEGGGRETPKDPNAGSQLEDYKKSLEGTIGEGIGEKIKKRTPYEMLLINTMFEEELKNLTFNLNQTKDQAKIQINEIYQDIVDQVDEGKAKFMEGGINKNIPTPAHKGIIGKMNVYDMSGQIKENREKNKEVLEKMKSDFQATYSIINETVGQPLRGLFDDFIEGTKKASEAFADFGKNLLKTIASFITNTLVSTFLTMFASMLVPGAGGALGFGKVLGSVLGFKDGGLIGSIPRAANGLVTAGAGGGIPAILHGNEVVSPLSAFQPMLDKALQAVMAKNGGGGVVNNFSINPQPGDSSNQNYWNDIFRNKILPAQKRWDRISNQE